MRVWTSGRYAVPLGGHPLRTDKFAAAAESLVRAGVLARADLAEPGPAAEATLLLVHEPGWVRRALSGDLSPAELEGLELPWSPELALAHRTHAQGTLEACRDALGSGLGLHAGGGSHHAFRDRGEGYCLFNDVAIGVVDALQRGVERAAVVDLDVHQGNGTAAIFAGEARVFTLSLHQADLYPETKVSGSLDVALPAGAGDAEYLEALRRALPAALDGHRPGLVVVVAGADPYERDLKGGLKLTKAGLAERDRLVLSACRESGIPVAVTLGGGYASDPADTVEIHAATLRIAVKSASGRSYRRARPLGGRAA